MKNSPRKCLIRWKIQRENLASFLVEKKIDYLQWKKNDTGILEARGWWTNCYRLLGGKGFRLRMLM